MIPSIGLTAYNIISGFLLAIFSFKGEARATVAIPAALLHIALGIALSKSQIKDLS